MEVPIHSVGNDTMLRPPLGLENQLTRPNSIENFVKKGPTLAMAKQGPSWVFNTWMCQYIVSAPTLCWGHLWDWKTNSQDQKALKILWKKRPTSAMANRVPVWIFNTWRCQYIVSAMQCLNCKSAYLPRDLVICFRLSWGKNVWVVNIDCTLRARHWISPPIAIHTPNFVKLRRYSLGLATKQWRQGFWITSKATSSIASEAPFAKTIKK
jgi:hypothetical protein